jgi:signal transduction histidine kinase
MSHELRTPLNSIIGFSGIMLQGIGGKLDESARHMITAIFESGEHLLALINDILDISKIEAGRLEFVIEPVDIRAMIKGWQSHLEVLVREKPLAFEVNVADEVPSHLIGDQARITQIANNLLSNAFKFTAHGKVSLSVRWLEKKLWIEVADTGIGIPQEALKYIFDEFRQVDASTQREHGGTGLGLSIVRRLCRAMGGDVKVSSELGKGSVFTVMLPLNEV